MALSTSFALIAALGAPVFEQTDAEVAARHTPAVYACERSPDHTGTLDQAICYRDEVVRQDRRLNQTWQRVIARLTPVRRTTLRRNERAWIKSRDVECAGEADDYINSTRAYMHNSCIVDADIRRTIWLEKLR